MYAIGNVIVGYPIDEDLYLNIDAEFDHEEWQDDFSEEDGILEWYSGSGPTPRAFGIELFTIDETEDIKFQDLLFDIAQAITEKNSMLRLQELYKNLDKRIKKHIRLEDCDVYIVWSTS